VRAWRVPLLRCELEDIAENLCQLGRCSRDRGRFGQVARQRPGRSRLGRRWDDLSACGLEAGLPAITSTNSLKWDVFGTQDGGQVFSLVSEQEDLSGRLGPGGRPGPLRAG
jgi:hypothetical protein